MSSLRRDLMCGLCGQREAGVILVPLSLVPLSLVILVPLSLSLFLCLCLELLAWKEELGQQTTGETNVTQVKERRTGCQWRIECRMGTMGVGIRGEEGMNLY